LTLTAWIIFLDLIVLSFYNLKMIIDVFLGLLLGISAFTDLKYHKVYNWITFPGMILGIGFNTIFYGLPGLRDSLIGLLTGGLFLLLGFLWGGIGGGDIKLLAAVGSLKGYSFVLWGGAYGIILCGIMAVITMVRQKVLIQSLKHIFYTLFSLLIPKLKLVPLERKDSSSLPFGFFIASGMILYWLELTFKIKWL
jgi:prepilin peptidase CpaA